MVVCRYCEIIHRHDSAYPLRDATHDINTNFPRCDWHWRFICGICGNPSHFNGMTWCPVDHKFICIDCSLSWRIVDVPFLGWDYYYQITCPQCKSSSPCLDRLEYEKKHPWQLNKKYHDQKLGVSPELIYSPLWQKGKPLRPSVIITDEKISRQWDDFADWWIERSKDLGDINRQYVIDPVIFNLLGNLKDKRILDAGCGSGYLSRSLAKKGASMVGIDISRKFIEYARKKESEEPLGIRYHQGSLSKLNMLDSSTFDFIVSNIVLSDVDNYEQAILEFHRILKPKGCIILSIMHPFFTMDLPHTGWEKQPNDSYRNEDRIYFKVDNYLSEYSVQWGIKARSPLTAFHRPLSHYINSIIHAGFTFDLMVEPKPTEAGLKKSPHFLPDCRIPLFIILKASKQSIAF